MDKTAGVLRLLVGLVLFLPTGGVYATEPHPTVYYFYQDGCPHCAQMSPWLDSLVAEHPSVALVKTNVSSSVENAKLLIATAEAYGVAPPAVPAVFLGERGWIGYSSAITAAIRAAVEECLADGCPEPLAELRDLAAPEPASAPTQPASSPPSPQSTQEAASGHGDAPSAESTQSTISLPAEVPPTSALPDRFASMSLVPATVLIAILDGFNPCSLWVLTFLLGMVVHSGSKTKMLVVGGVFLGVTALVYGLFIVGVVQALVLLDVVPWIRGVVGVVAIAMGAINAKEFFAFGRGPSLTLSAKRKRRFGDRVRRLLTSASPQSWPALVGGTALLAAGISLAELPCTAGFPVIWSGLVVDARLGTAAFGALLVLYLAVYLLDEIAVVAAAAVTFRRIEMTETRGLRLKLIGGVVMIALGIVMIVRPDALESLRSVVVVFAIAAAVAAAVIVGERAITRRAKDGKRL